MSKESNYNSRLFYQLIENELSPQDAETLISWLGSKKLDPEVANLILAQLKKAVAKEQLTPQLIETLEARLPLILQSAKKRPTRRPVIFNMKWTRYAAAILLIVAGFSTYLIFWNKSSEKETTSINTPAQTLDISPGKEGAILTLDDGSSVLLDDANNGLVATQNGTKILLNNGKLTYSPTSLSGSEKTSYNTMTTPKGRQFQLLLPDGSKVWLNAASSIRYPTVFKGKERKVEITGEAYFEVAKNANAPFKVRINEETEIEVLGTQFNINSYNNEDDIRTTLLEGSVRISNKGENAVLNPGQQAQVNGSLSPIRIINNVDVDKVMAWKNGIFNFQDATLEEVMRQLERWYDIDVVYEKGIPKLEFFGKMGRDLKLSEVLRGLQISEVRCRIEDGRRLVITP